MFDTDEKVSNYENKTEISVIMFLKYEIKINVLGIWNIKLPSR